jgi:RNA polymerase sigma factor (sigma-70 family)
VKPVMPRRLIEAIREVREGGVPMSRAIARQVIEAFRTSQERPTAGVGAVSSGSKPEEAKPDDPLTPRERQVLELLVEGYSYQETAAQLGISIGTVGTYVERIYEKLHVSCRREMVAWSKGR